MLNDYENAQMLQNLMNNISDSIYFKDLHSRFVIVNQACAHKHGWESSEFMVGSSDYDTFTKEHAEKAFSDEQLIIQTGEPLHAVEEKETWPDGSETWASTTKMPLRDRDGTIVGTFGISRDVTQRKKAELRVRKYVDEIRLIKEEMENDVRLAGKLQKSFFSASYPEFKAPDGSLCIEFMHRFILNRQVTGDYCSVVPVSEHEAGIFLSDVRGTGIRAALGTALIRGIMQEISASAAEPEIYLKRMNDMLVPLLKQEGFTLDAAACYFVVDARNGEIRLANAGHTMPILFRNSNTAQWLCEESSCVGPALALQADAEYTTVHLTISENDAVVAFTDGLTSVKNNTGNEYGIKRLLGSAHSFTGEPLADIFQGLEDDALAFSRAEMFSDDVCMIGFHLKQLMG